MKALKLFNDEASHWSEEADSHCLNKEESIRAMKEYAGAFAEWAAKNHYEWHGPKGWAFLTLAEWPEPNEDPWRVSHYVTTEELLNLFEQEP